MASLLLLSTQAAVIDFEQRGGIADDSSLSAARNNSLILNSTLAALQPGDTFRVPNKTFTYLGGVVASGLHDVTIQLDGTLQISSDTKAYPRGTASDPKMPRDAIYLKDLNNVTISSAGTGTLDGNGAAWWGLVKYLENTNHRPVSLHIETAHQLVIENILFLDAPRYMLY